MTDEVIRHLIDIKERLSSVEANTEGLREDVRETRLEQQKIEARITHVEKDVNKAKGSIASIKWLIGICFGIPGVVFTLLKITGKG